MTTSPLKYVLSADRRWVALATNPICEVCGEPATTRSVDTIVIDPPVPDDKGQLWAWQHTEGPTHYRCPEHPWQIKHREAKHKAP